MLSLETNDATLVRMINIQELVSRLQIDLWRLRGLVSSALRGNSMRPEQDGELLLRRDDLAVLCSRIDALADERTKASLHHLLESGPYQDILKFAGEVVLKSPGATDFQSICAFDVYQKGPYAQVEPVFRELADVSVQQMTDYTNQRLHEAWMELATLYGVVGVVIAALLGLIL